MVAAIAEASQLTAAARVSCRIAGWKVTEVIVQHFPREAGQSIHRPFKMLGTIWRVIRYLFDLRGEIEQAEQLRRLVAKGKAQ